MPKRFDPQKFDGSKVHPVPIKLPNFKGYAAAVPLDYDMHVIDRIEHSIILIPDTWSSLVDLIYDPQAFVSDVYTAYSKMTTITTGTEDALKLDWSLLSPMTIKIEPLTIATPGSINALRFLNVTEVAKHKSVVSNLSTLFELCHVDPQNQIVPENSGLPALPATWGVPIGNNVEAWKLMSPVQFRNAVLHVFQTVNSKVEGFYLVEFALDTHSLIVRYVPPHANYVEPFYTSNDRQFYPSGLVSPFTVSRIGTTPMATGFLHFDLDLSPYNNKRTHHEVALAKAQFVTEFISDPEKLMTTLWAPGNQRVFEWVEGPPGVWTKAQKNMDQEFSYSSGVLRAQGQQLPLSQMAKDKSGPSSSAFPFDPFVAYRQDATVVIESVWASPPVEPMVNPPYFSRGRKDRKKTGVLDSGLKDDHQILGKGGGGAPGIGDPAPFCCVVVTVVVNGQQQFQIAEWSTLVKGYVAPQLP